MLLCVGSFFNSTLECQQQWKEYVEGRETGWSNLKRDLVQKLHVILILSSDTVCSPLLFHIVTVLIVYKTML